MLLSFYQLYLFNDSLVMTYTPNWKEQFTSYPYAQQLSAEIHKFNPQAKIQWYLTWGRPNGDDDRCDEIPQVCTYEGMQDAVTNTYSTYGCMFNPGQVAPSGEAFRKELRVLE